MFVYFGQLIFVIYVFWELVIEEEIIFVSSAKDVGVLHYIFIVLQIRVDFTDHLRYLGSHSPLSAQGGVLKAVHDQSFKH